MTQVTLRDLATNEDIVVPPEGFIFGRVGGDADIQLEDNSISRRQARVSLKGGQWLLETLAVPQGQRAPRPVQLQEGATFNVGQSEFEVVQIEFDEAEEEEVDPGARTIQPPAKGKPGQAPLPAKKAPPAPNAKTAPSAPMQKRSAPPAAAEEGGDEVPAKGFGAMFVAAPKGLAYYLLNVPKMLVNPFGTVRATIEEQPNEPMGKIELIGYALPALLATGMLGSIASGLALLIGPGHVFSLMAFLPIVPIIVAFVSAIITGFIFHPVLTWIITKLKGESDARSRTNYFLQTMTLSILLAVPNALGVILAALPIPFINLLGPVLSVVATLVSIYVTIQWFEYFKVVKWVKTVLLVLGALAVFGTGYGLVMGLLNTIRGFGSHSTPVAAAEGDAAEAVEAATGGLEEMPTDPEEAKAWAEKR
ncbi:MAG: FHA domain-containing protein, partial [Myxococcota bacterium]